MTSVPWWSALPPSKPQAHVDASAILSRRHETGLDRLVSLPAHYASGAELWDHKTFTTNTWLAATWIPIGGSSRIFGGRVRREKEMPDRTVGAEFPRWYDPANPGDVMVRRGFGGTYLFALFPLPVFWFGLCCVRRKKE